VAAGVHHGPQAAIALAHDDEGHATDAVGQMIAGMGQRRAQSEEHRTVAEQQPELTLEPHRVGVGLGRVHEARRGLQSLEVLAGGGDPPQQLDLSFVAHSWLVSSLIRLVRLSV
jgi:hypothetical protein